MAIFGLPKKKIFLVGCPRSGTTLLQSLLTAHPQITSFPESHFFRHLIPKPSSRRYLFGIISRKAKPRFEAFLKELEREDLLSYLPNSAIFQYQYVHSFIKVLDQITQEQGKTIWIEKTPGHIHYIDYIQKNIKEAKFIHIVRNGTDVVASLYEVTHNYPQIWGEAWSINKCIKQWTKDVAISLQYQARPNHILVRYEQLVIDPTLILREICNFINIDFNKVMLEKYMMTTKSIVLDNEPWKNSVQDSIKNRNGQKFEKLFNQKQRKYIINELSGTLNKLNF